MKGPRVSKTTQLQAAAPWLGDQQAAAGSTIVIPPPGHSRPSRCTYPMGFPAWWNSFSTPTWLLTLQVPPSTANVLLPREEGLRPQGFTSASLGSTPPGSRVSVSFSAAEGSDPCANTCGRSAVYSVSPGAAGSAVGLKPVMEPVYH